MNNALLLWSAYLYLVGAFLSYWIVDESVKERPWVAAFWFVAMPFDVLMGVLQRERDVLPDDDDNEGGV